MCELKTFDSVNKEWHPALVENITLDRVCAVVHQSVEHTSQIQEKPDYQNLEQIASYTDDNELMNCKQG
jgi:hypothetical protein